MESIAVDIAVWLLGQLIRGVCLGLRWCGVAAWEAGGREVRAYRQRQAAWERHAQEPRTSLLRPAAGAAPCEAIQLLRADTTE